MTKITLLGDSIRLNGYGKLVPELLGENYEVYQPVENCCFSQFTLYNLLFWQSRMSGSNIVHWNNGLWDMHPCVDGDKLDSTEVYVKRMLRIADYLQKEYGAVIFATTTPVLDGHEIDNSVIEEYNNALVPELRKKGVIINDLHSLVMQNRDEYLNDDNIHLTEKGAEACAQQVTRIIKETAETL